MIFGLFCDGLVALFGCNVPRLCPLPLLKVGKLRFSIDFRVLSDNFAVVRWVREDDVFGWICRLRAVLLFVCLVCDVPSFPQAPLRLVLVYAK